ncbi:MAG: hypothetical protein LBI53_08260 [Candidatus Peribacteria bacterium]|jgi:hypothetical protein|nr:hypothetical protein [Candidatus Peribacteria bacterium]
MNENIGLFAKNGDLIGEIDPKTGEIIIKDNYKSIIEIRVEVIMSPQVHIYDKKSQKVLFSIHLPTEKVGEITAPGYEISPIQQDMGVFNNGKVIQKNGTNVLFIGPQGQLYSEKGISGTYHYNSSKQEIEYHLQENITNSTIKIPLKVQPFQKK